MATTPSTSLRAIERAAESQRSPQDAASEILKAVDRLRIAAKKGARVAGRSSALAPLEALRQKVPVGTEIWVQNGVVAKGSRIAQIGSVEIKAPYKSTLVRHFRDIEQTPWVELVNQRSLGTRLTVPSELADLFRQDDRVPLQLNDEGVGPMLTRWLERLLFASASPSTTRKRGHLVGKVVAVEKTLGSEFSNITVRLVDEDQCPAMQGRHVRLRLK